MLWLINSLVVSFLTWSLLCIYNYGAAAEDYGILTGHDAEELNMTGYNIKENYCRMLGHSSVIQRDCAGAQKVYVDGGLVLYGVERDLTTIDSVTQKTITTSEWHIAEYQANLVTLELNRDFQLEEAHLHMKVIQKPSLDPKRPGIAADSDPPTVSRGYMWIDSQGNIYQSGGHFSARRYFNESRYNIPKNQIPDFRIWKYDPKTGDWSPIKPQTLGESMIRLVSSATISIPSIDMSYVFAGHLSPRSARDNALPTSGRLGNWATKGMIKFNHTSNRAWNITGPPGEVGYSHGALHHIGPFEDHPGYLLVLMAKEYNLNLEFEEDDPTMGKSFDFTELRFFDLQKEEWFTQRASYFNGEKPATRTRFCSVLVRDGETGPWDLWLYGGQGTEDIVDPESAGGIWVLTMPGFIWMKVSHALEKTPIRGHTCHAVGSQLVVLGGWTPGKDPDPTIACDTNLVKVFNMNERSWEAGFKANTTYKQFDELAGLRGEKPPADLDSRLAMIDMPTTSQCTTPAPPTPSSRTRKWPAIVGGVVGGVVLIVLILLAIVGYRRYRNRPIDESDSSQNIHKPTSNSPNGLIPVESKAPAVHSAGGGEPSE